MPWFDAANASGCLVRQQHVSHDEHQRLVERDVDLLALAGAFPPVKRHRGAECCRDPGDGVGEPERR
jgi:hypothetical protein